jgi:hypothetical protein
VEITGGLDYVSGRYTSKDRVLLINPPVVEARYQWSRWNQPLDLLKLGGFLKKEFGCEVKLFDFMLPVNGKVTRTTNKPDSIINLEQYTFPLWRWGRREEDFSKWFEKLLIHWRPTDIWITSLTTYWWKGVASTIVNIKNIYRDAHIVLYGQYPMLETKHAEQKSFADVLVKDKIELINYPSDISLYEESKPEFCAIDGRSPDWHRDVLDKFDLGITDFVFFNDPVINDDSETFLRQLRLLQEKASKATAKRRLEFHGICGFYPAHFTEEVAAEMKAVGFAELHFEYQPNGDDLNLDAYKKASEAYDHANFNFRPDQLSGFINIGLPNDDLERIIRHMMNLFEFYGSVILKPYTPTPGSKDYEEYKDIIETKEIERLSPHFFPFSKVNKISLEDYQELYTLAASLNRKVRNKSFDSFPGTLAFEMIKKSLEREVWTVSNDKSASN